MIKLVYEFLITNLMQILTAIGMVAAIVAAWASVKVLHPKAKPSLEEFKTLIGLYSQERIIMQGDFLVRNTGPKPCSITGIHLKGSISFPDINVVSVNAQPDIYGRGGHKLPLPIEGHILKRVFLITEPGGACPKEMPESIILEVKFDCMKEPIRKTVNRVGDTNQYS
jgi:hypothetical protein